MRDLRSPDRRNPLATLTIREGSACKASLPAVLGKTRAVRNDRRIGENVGIIRSPVRASILADYIRLTTRKAHSEQMFSGLPR
jgi:hypothetical protein